MPDHNTAMRFAAAIFLALTAFAHAAKLEFDEPAKEVNAPADARTVTTDFTFTNKTDKPVTIAKSDPGCSCLQVQVKGGKLKYEPGESGLIRATFDMENFSGSVDKVIGLWLDNDPEDRPSQRITVKVNIPILVAVDPKTVSWEVGEKPEAKTIKLTMAGDEPIHVAKVTSSSGTFTTEVKTVEDGKKYEIVVTPSSTDGPGIGVMRIETDCKIAKHKIQQAFGVVRKPAAKP